MTWPLVISTSPNRPTIKNGRMLPTPKFEAWIYGRVVLKMEKGVRVMAETGLTQHQMDTCVRREAERRGHGKYLTPRGARFAEGLYSRERHCMACGRSTRT